MENKMLKSLSFARVDVATAGKFGAVDGFNSP